MKSLKDYSSLSKVPFEHQAVKYKCLCPQAICADAVGDYGCLGLDNEPGECPFMAPKKFHLTDITRKNLHL